MKRIIFGIVGLLLMTSVGYCQEKKSYTEPYFGSYTVNYPSRWTPVEDRNSVAVGFVIPQVNPRAYVSIYYLDKSAVEKNATPEDHDADIRKTTWKAFYESTSDKVLEEGKANLAGKEARFWVKADPTLVLKRKEKYYIFTAGSKIFTLSYSARTEFFDTYLEEGEEIIHSIKIKE